MKQILFISIVLNLSSVYAVCPLGSSEKKLTLARVMRNFGRFIMPAESLILKLRNNEVVVKSSFMESIEKLSTVYSCSNEVFLDQGNDLDLLPTKARQLKNDQLLAEYKEDFLYFLEEFQISIKEFQDQLIKFSVAYEQASNTELMLSNLIKHQKELDQLIDRAHNKLTD